MVIRVIDVRHYKFGSKANLEVACEVSRIVGGKTITDVIPDITLNPDVARDETLFIDALKREVYAIFPPSSPKRFIGMEITVDGS